jgi:hypothetical protein
MSVRRRVGPATGDNGDDLTVAEAAAIENLRRLARAWPQTLRLISMDGALSVIHADDWRFGHFDRTMRQESILAEIDGIPNEGGAW